MAIIKFFKNYLFRKDIHYKVLEKIRLFNRRNFKNSFIDQKDLIPEKNKVIIFDVGAHIGQTIKKYKSTFPNSKIFAFEPYPNSYKVLKKLFNNCNDILIYPYGLSNTSEEMTFYLSKYDNLNSFKKPNQSAWGFDDGNTINVETTTLDIFCSKHDINYIDILKIDVQGSEVELLKGSHELLTKEKIGLIYIEWQVVPLYENHSLYFEIGSILKQYGFELFNFYNVNEARSGQIRWADAIYTSPALRKKLVSKYGKGQGSGW